MIELTLDMLQRNELCICKIDDFVFDETRDRLEELHRAIDEGVDFNTLTAEDRKLLMDDVDAAIADY